jgi:hypothetical protein
MHGAEKEPTALHADRILEHDLSKRYFQCEHRDAVQVGKDQDKVVPWQFLGAVGQCLTFFPECSVRY